jgi:hypothetical protein
MSHSVEKEERIQTWILAMLMDDDESPWILHTQLTEHFPEITVATVVSTLVHMEESGWVVRWLPKEDQEASTGKPMNEYFEEAQVEYERWVERGRHHRSVFQEYGPWFMITRLGKSEWERRKPEFRRLLS